MPPVNRREFLSSALAAKSYRVLPHWLSQIAPPLAQASHAPGGNQPTLERFVDPLPILERLEPIARSKNSSRYRMTMAECTHRFHSSLPPTRVWGYENRFPGPSIDVDQGHQVQIEWRNRLPLRHLFAVDPHIHGAMPPAPAVRTVPHVHGSNTDSASDGLPEMWFVPGESALYTYPNRQRGATLWYHDHALGITRLNVCAGLSGFYLIRDVQERRLELPDGPYEIPLMLQDRQISPSGELLYKPTHDDGLELPPGVWGPEFFGSFPVLNGAVYPYLEVEPRLYRFRLLNASNARFFQLYLNLAASPTDVPSYVPFQQIGSDGGLLSRPVTLTRLLLAPGERADLLIDFSATAGKTITLGNDAAAPYPGWGMGSLHAPPLLDLMQFRCAHSPSKVHTGPLSAPFAPIERLDPALATKHRDFVIIERMDEKGRSLGVRINGKDYSDPVTETVKLGSLETWRFINTTEDAHPMHLHLVQFQVLYRQGFNPEEHRKGNLVPVGSQRPPAEQEAGWKDTAVVLPGEMLTILVRFEGYTGQYVFHCHMLEHEDNDMMRPFIVER